MLKPSNWITKTNLKELEEKLVYLNNDLFLVIEDYNRITNYEEEYLMNIFKNQYDLQAIIKLSENYNLITEF